jgi:hypothetical protein
MGFAQIHKWPERNYALVVKRDRGEPLVVIRLRDAVEVAKVAEGKKLLEVSLVPEADAGSTAVEDIRARISAA